MATEMTFFEAVGGEETFRRLVDHFYAGVADDPLLRPLYPEEDLGPAAERLRLFLIQYWGGPKTYSMQRGHPRLRMRHMPFRIGPAEHDAWLRHMRTAVDELALPEQLDAMLWNYLVMAAGTLINAPAGPETAGGTTGGGGTQVGMPQPRRSATMPPTSPAGEPPHRPL